MRGFGDEEGHLRDTEKEPRSTEDLDKARQDHLQRRSNSESQNTTQRMALEHEYWLDERLEGRCVYTEMVASGSTASECKPERERERRGGATWQ